MNRNKTGSILSIVAAALVLGCSTSSPQPATVPPEQARADSTAANRQADMGTTKSDTTCVPLATERAMGDTTAIARMDSATGKPYCTSQTQSGVTSPGATSTLGAGVSETSADQAQPVMAKGDTLRKAESPAAR
jgi:hypothetical protein